MKNEDSEARLRAVLARMAKQDVASFGIDEDLIERLGLDSLQGLRILASLEKTFAIRFEDGKLGELRTIRSLLEAIQAARGEVVS